MALSRFAFEIDTKGLCLLCLTSINCRIYAEKEDNSDSVTATAFKKFLRFLKVDTTEITLGLGTSKQALQNVDLSVFLCDDCSSVTNEFLDLHQKFENIRRQRDTCIGQLHFFMEQGVQDPDRVREYEKRINAGKMEHGIDRVLVDRLRKEAFEKASQRVQSALQRMRSYLNELGTDFDEAGASTRGNVAEPVPPRRNKKNLEVKQGEPEQAEVRSFSVCSALEIGGSLDLSAVAAGTEEADSGSSVLEDGNMNDKQQEITPTGQVQNMSSEPKPSSSGKWSCDYCERKCSLKPILATHIFERHALAFLSDTRVLPPGFTEQQLETSLAGILEKQSSRGFHCPFCNKKFQTQRYGRVHLLKIHAEDVIGVGEGRRSNSNNMLQGHMPPWKCIPCQKTFVSKQNFQKHQYNRHLVAYLSSEGLLPPGMSEQQLEKSIGGFLGRVEDFSGDVQCPLCHMGTYKKRKYQLRIHILNVHLEQVLENVEDDSDRASKSSAILPEDK